MYRLNVVAIIDFFNGVVNLSVGLSKIEAKGCSIGAVEKWRERGVVPTQKLLLMKAYADRLGREFNIESYILKESAES